MHIARLRQVGGSVMLTIPPAFLDQLALTAQASVGVVIENGRLIIEPAQNRPRYSAADLLSQCDIDAPLPEFDAAWVSGGAIGDELI